MDVMFAWCVGIVYFFVTFVICFFTGPRKVPEGGDNNRCRRGDEEVGMEWIRGRFMSDGITERRYVCTKYMHWVWATASLSFQ